MAQKKDRAFYMSPEQKRQMGFDAATGACKVARTHANCKELTGVARPGKTAKDRARSES